MNNLKKFEEIADSIDDAIKSQMFGKPCIKHNGKAFVCFFQDEMVFKLPLQRVGELLKEVKDSKLFDPSGKGRVMKEWIQIPSAYIEKWNDLANEALNYLKLK